MTTEAQKRARVKYEAKLDSFILKLNREKDADVIAKLRSVPCITGYIRTLVREDTRG